MVASYKVLKGTAVLFLITTLTGSSQQVIFTRANNSTNNITIPAGEVWKVTHWFSDYGTSTGDCIFELPGAFRFRKGSMESPEFRSFLNSFDSNRFSSESPVGAILVGPTNIVAQPAISNDNGSYILIFEKIVSQKNQANSASPIVIPTSTINDVEIKIEHSTDSVNWTECQPGTYNSSTVRRFFRLRALEK